MKPVEIVITGGPCAGKTTSLSYIPEKLRDRGFRTFVVPEVATMFITGGVPDIGKIAIEHPSQYIDLQDQMLKTQLALRERFQDLAQIFPSEKAVILYDRGPMDCLAYTPPEYFEALLTHSGLSMTEVRDSYDGVFHLVTAADGAEAFYTKANNEARRESASEARDADLRTLGSWSGHPHLRVIDNSTGFEEKMQRLLKAISRVLGVPVPIEIERKFLLRTAPTLEQLKEYHPQVIYIEQTYLENPDDVNEELRIRKRSQHGSSLFYKTRKKKIRPGVRHETEEQISHREFLDLRRFQKPGTRTIRKNRICFLYQNQYFELDVFKDLDCVLLEIELTEENDALILPPWLDVEGEVTNDEFYSNAHLALTECS